MPTLAAFVISLSLSFFLSFFLSLCNWEEKERYDSDNISYPGSGAGVLLSITWKPAEIDNGVFIGHLLYFQTFLIASIPTLESIFQDTSYIKSGFIISFFLPVLRSSLSFFNFKSAGRVLLCLFVFYFFIIKIN